MAVGLPSVISSTTFRVAARVGSLKAAAIGTRAVLSASIVLVAPLLGVSPFTLVFRVLIKALVGISHRHIGLADVRGKVIVAGRIAAAAPSETDHANTVVSGEVII